MKRIKIMMSVVLAIILSCSCFSVAFAAEPIYTLDTPYQFPVTPNDPEWKDFQEKEDMLAVCQIPEAILKKMTTEALLETVLMYPFITDYFAFNKYEDAAKTFMNDFNGFRELFSRNDLTEKLLAKYQESSIITESSAATAKASLPSDFFEVSNIEFLIGYDQILHDDYSAVEASEFDAILANKMEIRDDLDFLSSNSETYLKFMSQKTPISPAAISYTTVKTPKGTSVSVMKISPDLTATEKANINSQFDKAYPNAIRKGSATTNYNCHSYAWYNQSTSNIYWMNDPGAYMSDGSYKQHTDLRPREGFKAYYYNGNHSAIVKQIRMIEGAQTFWYWSKWGSAGLYEHSIYYCPYATGVRHYYISAT